MILMPEEKYSIFIKIKKIIALDKLNILITFTATLFINFYKDDIIPDLADTAPGDDIFAAGLPETEAEAAGTGDYQGSDTAGLTVEFHIYRTAKCTTGTDIDYLFLLQFTNSHE